MAGKYRLPDASVRWFIAILLVWVIASFLGMMGYGTTEGRPICLINAVVGCLGLIALGSAHHIKPTRK